MTSLLSPSDDPCDLKAECSPIMDNEISTANSEKGELEMEERKLKEQEEEAGEEVVEVEEGEEEEISNEEQEPLTEEQELEELRAQVLQLLLELDDARETSNKHQEGFHELQGGSQSPETLPL